ncbi:MAG TPA: restriction endonuclease subunit S [Bacteroidales bacterium]|nr:restriction endonuclease subunit S [Bacteroidales bacterium]HQN16782.1 restriction endonuclease subunit S [Bacteroidales bacterium]HQP16392.1 restriction endonuclease subunit S [Bacteroidales bacterium]
MNSVNKINTPSAPGIPNHWQLKKLGEVGEIISGGTPSTKVAAYWNGTISWITPADLSCYDKKIITKGRKSITVIGLKNSSSRLLPKGSILFSSRAPIGYVAIAGNEVCTNQGFKSIIPDKSILSEYLFYFLKASKQNAEKVASGTTFKEISMKAFSQLEIPLPPLPEQQAIVAKIEELFSELDKGVESLKTAQQQLKVYRQSLLKWAFEGRLTSAYFDKAQHEPLSGRPRLLSEAETSGNMAAEEKEKYGNNELPEGWIETEIKNVCLDIKVGIVIKPTNFYSKTGKGIKAFRSANVRELKINDADWVYFTKEANEINHRTKLNFGDVLIVRSGYPGTSCIVSKEFEGCNAIDILIATPNKEKILPEYLCYFNNSPLGKGLFILKSRGVAQKHLNVGEYSKLVVHIPSLKEQQRIVDELESRLTVCDKIEKTINEGLQQSEALRQSILKRAFEGRLV